MSGPAYIGIDCGGTSLRGAVASASGDVLAELSEPTGDAQEREDGLGEALLSFVERLVDQREAGPGSIRGIGIGLPFVCWGGKAHLCRNVRALDPERLKGALARRYGAGVSLWNDVKCAALGESWRGAAVGADPFIYLNIGTGLSAALYAGGSVYQGAHGASGEIAYWVTEAARLDGLADGYGPLEEAMSGVGLSGAYLNATGERLGAREIFALADRGDRVAAGIIERGFGFLLPAIANLLTFADPELLVIGGGVAEGLAGRSDRIESYIARMTPFPPRVAWSSLDGNAGLVGAVRLAMIGAASG
ncbi:MAG: ROK family protein [Spirochaetes bacterium]|nr:ROK family protein [Spirochaetota bacterium]MBU1080053.1 ROK family protein [Spirochaetota bacterium]